MLEIAGWSAAFLLSICGLPQAIKSFKEGHSNGVSLSFVISWSLGCILMLIYVIPTGSLPLIVDYVLNICFTLIILFYKVRPRKGLSPL